MKILIMSGGNLKLDWAGKFLKDRKYDYIIAADSGLEHLLDLGLKPNLILGDYDSLDSKIYDQIRDDENIIKYPRKKDYTDTEIALRKAIELLEENKREEQTKDDRSQDQHDRSQNQHDRSQDQHDSIDLLAATGSRFDHTLTNVSIMKLALKKEIDACIFDEHNKIYLLDSGKAAKLDKDKQYGDFVSLIPMSPDCYVRTWGMEYDIKEFSLLEQGLSLTQSNEIKERQAFIELSRGWCVLVESKD